MDAATHRILYFSFIYRKERIEDYLAGIAYLKGQGIQVNGVISDGLSGLKKSLGTNPLPILSVPSSAAHQTAAHQSSKTSCFYRFEGD